MSKFVWYDLMTADTTAAEAFYRSVIGWDAKDSGMPHASYTIFSKGQAQVGGLMPIPEDVRAAGGRPSWRGYVGVDDVDAHSSRVEAAGGTICHPPSDIPGVGRFAVVADPNGATFLLFSVTVQPENPPQNAAPGAPGHVGWHELHSADYESAFPFYSSLFGWTKQEAIDMGELGTYQIFAADGVPAGGFMNNGPESPIPFWLYYFNVEGVEAAAERVKKSGGEIVKGPDQVPGGSWILQCLDPQGAMFAMVGPKG